MAARDDGPVKLAGTPMIVQHLVAWSSVGQEPATDVPMASCHDVSVGIMIMHMHSV